VAVDTFGNVFIADYVNNRIRKVDTNGVITTVAGNGGGTFKGDGGAATNASLNRPNGVAVDTFGNFLIADMNNYRVRRVDTNGVITTVAGNGSFFFSGDGGAATNTSLYPFGVAVDASGNLFIADGGNNRVLVIHAVASNLIVKSVAVTNTGNYQVIVTSPYGSVTSAVATLSLSGSPSILTQPVNTPVALGGNTVLSVSATGTQPLSYAWYFGGTNLLQNGTNSTLPLPNVSELEGGPYSVIIRNMFGSVTSVVATLSVGLPPNITQQPASRTSLAWTTSTLSVAVSGTGPFTYQWLMNGSNLRDGIISTVVGNGSYGFSGDGGAATNAVLEGPVSVAVDASGTLFFEDGYNNRVRRVDTNGVITTVAGNGVGAYTGDGGAATNASLDDPSGVAIDGSGNILIADLNNSRIRRVDANGIITTVAGNGLFGFSGDGGAATHAELDSPSDVAIDGSGNLFIADQVNNRVRKVDTNGFITTLAGNGLLGISGDGATATNAELDSPYGLAVDASGNLFIAEPYNNLVRRVDTNGFITTVAGDGYVNLATGYSRYSGDGGAATNASLNRPLGLAVDAFGNLFIADSQNDVIRMVDTNGFITTVAGDYSKGGSYSGDGTTATNASLSFPSDVAVDLSGNLFIADQGNHRVREVRLGASSLILNSFSAANTGNYQVIVTSPYGSVTSAVATLTVVFPPSIISQPFNVAAAVGSVASLSVDASGTAPLTYSWYSNGTNLVQSSANSTLSFTNASAAESGGYTVVVTNLYGSATSVVVTLGVGFPPSIITEPAGQTVNAGASVSLSVDAVGPGPFTFRWQVNGGILANDIITTVAGIGSAASSGDGAAATNAGLDPTGVAVDSSSTLFIAEYLNNRVRKVDAKGMITTIAGTGTQGYSGDGGAATNASLNGPDRLAVDASGNLFIADSNNQCVRKVDTNGVITTVAGNGVKGYSGDGGAATNASLDFPRSVAADASGNLFIADCNNHRVRKVDANGMITTVAGNGVNGYSGDGGTATNASLSFVQGVMADAFGNLFISDTGNNRIREVNAKGVISTFAGKGTEGFFGDGGLASDAGLFGPVCLAADGFGNCYVADLLNYRIRRVDLNDIITTVAGDGSSGFSGDGGAATNAGLYPSSVAVDSSGNIFISDPLNNRIREVPLGGLSNLTLNNVSTTNSGNYQVIVTSPYGSVTSAVATLTVLSSNQVPPAITMNAPLLAGNNLLLGFNLSQGSSSSFTLLQSASATGPWTTNTAASLATNAQAGGYQFTLPVPGSTQFYQVFGVRP
jgi:sugar lactone lactonase YvrE